MRTRRLLGAVIVAALIATGSRAAEGYVFLSNTWWISNNLPEGSWMMNMATGDTTRVSPAFYRCGAISPDGRELVGYLWDGWEIMNNDGTNRRRLCTGDHNTQFSLGWQERVAFTNQGVWWVCTDGDFTFKHLMFCDRTTGTIEQVADLSSYGDAVQGYWASSDGLHGMAWLHEETVTVSFTSHKTNPTVRVMTGVWGHGPILTRDGDRVIISAMSADRDLGAGNPDHKTFVVYDWATGVLGTFVDRFVCNTTNKISIGGQWPAANHNSYLLFKTETDGNRYWLNWETHAYEQIADVNGGSVMGVWHGALPNPHVDVPAVGLDKSSLEFLAVSGNPASQNVTVSNLGTGTLDDVTTTIAPTVAGAWLTVTRSGTGNSQTLQNSINATALPNGVHTATVTVRASNSSTSPSYAVTFTKGSQVSAASELLLDVAYNGADIALHWQDNSTNETGFIIERSTNGGGFNELTRVGANVESYTNAGLGAGTYEYRVVAYDATGNAAPSNTRTETLTGNPRFAITNPNPGDTLWIGQSFTFQWTSEIADLVEVMLSADDGEHWTTLNATGGIGSNSPLWGNFAATIPNTPSSSALLKIRKYGDESVKVELTGLVIAQSTGVSSALASRAGHTYHAALVDEHSIRVVGPGGATVRGEIFSLDGSRAGVFEGRANTRIPLTGRLRASTSRTTLLVRIRETGSSATRILPVR
jgi:hypothetical protein